MKKIIFLLISLSLFYSCNKKPEYDLYIYNSKGENAAQFEQMAKDYEAATDVKVKIFSIGSGQDHMETLRSEMNSRNKPSIFAIQGLKELVEWYEGGFALNFEDATLDEFISLANDVPQEMRLTTDGINSYGIPYNLEGFGFIFDKNMIMDLFDSENIEQLIADLKQCSYQEFEVFVQNISNYINSPSAVTIVLNGNKYMLRANKTGLANNLTGVFAVMGAERWTYGDHTMTVALNTVFDSPAASYNATIEDVESIVEPVKQYAKLLDLKTKHLAGKDGPEKRGPAFVASANYGYDPTVQIFANSKALFLKQGNWAYGNIENVDKEMATRLEFMPVKMPLTEEMIIVDGYDLERFNNSIPVFVPNYYAINTKVSDEEKQRAQEFLVWLNTTDEGKKYIVEAFNFIPYNADISTTKLDNSLANSILEYVSEGKTQNNSVMGTPATLTGTIVGTKIMEEYMTKENWTEEDYKDIANYTVENWKKLIK